MVGKRCLGNGRFWYKHFSPLQEKHELQGCIPTVMLPRAGRIEYFSTKTASNSALNSCLGAVFKYLSGVLFCLPELSVEAF